MTPIEAVLRHYFPGWEAPADNGRTWTPCLCPSHDEERESCSVSFELGAVHCKACGFKGDVISIVRRMEPGEVTYAEAVLRAEDILAGSDVEVPQDLGRKSGRGVSRRSRTGRRSRPVPPWLRS